MTQPTVFISYSHKDEERHLARGDKDQARAGLAAAREMVEQMGYHRRDGEVEELEKILGTERGGGHVRRTSIFMAGPWSPPTAGHLEQRLQYHA